MPYIAKDTGTESTSAPATVLPDWREAVAIVMERAWIGIFVALAVILYFWFDLQGQIPYYRSSATLIVEIQAPRFAGMGVQEAMTYNLSSLEYFNTHIKILHSRRIMQHAIEAGGLANRPDFTPGVDTGPRQVDAALRYISIIPVQQSRLIEITAEHPNPQIAADLANAISKAYIQQELDNRMNASMESVEWLRARSEEYRVRLEEGLLSLQQYREANLTISLESDQEIVLSRLHALNSSLTASQTELIGISTRWNRVQQLLEQESPLTEIAVILEDGDVRNALQQWRSQQRRIESLRQRYRSGHPDYQAALEETQNLESNFEKVCQRAIDTLRARFELLKEREENLQQALVEQEQLAFAIDRKLVDYNDLRRNVEAEEQVYQAIIDRMKQASLSETLPSDIIRLAEEARPAGAPFRPNPRAIMTRAGSLGVAFGLAAIFALYFADHRFRRNEEVERQLGLPVLGTLPLIAAKSFSDRGLIMHRKDTSESAEAFRTLRAGLAMHPDLREHRSLMITSTHAGEGKTLVATNLAIAFAQEGQRTLLLGTDMRRPALHKIFEQPHKKGLSDIIADGLDWREALMACDVPNLDILAAGRGARRPADLLGSSNMGTLLRKLKEHYQRIIIDAPPIMGLSDTLVLVSHADSVLCVVRYGVTHSFGAKHAIRKIEAGGIRCSGVIMNGVNLRSLANYYYYRRYGGYAYRYYSDERQGGKLKQKPM